MALPGIDGAIECLAVMCLITIIMQINKGLEKTQNASLVDVKSQDSIQSTLHRRRFFIPRTTHKWSGSLSSGLFN